MVASCVPYRCKQIASLNAVSMQCMQLATLALGTGTVSTQRSNNGFGKIIPGSSKRCAPSLATVFMAIKIQVVCMATTPRAHGATMRCAIIIACELYGTHCIGWLRKTYFRESARLGLLWILNSKPMVPVRYRYSSLLSMLPMLAYSFDRSQMLAFVRVQCWRDARKPSRSYPQQSCGRCPLPLQIPSQRRGRSNQSSLRRLLKSCSLIYKQVQQAAWLPQTTTSIEPPQCWRCALNEKHGMA